VEEIILTGTELARMLQQIGIEEVFEYTVPDRGTLLFNIDAAKKAVADGRILRTVEIDRAEMEHIASRNLIRAEYVAAADHTQPGIAAPMLVDDEVIYILIDGNHRCARAVQINAPFFAHILPVDAAIESIITFEPQLTPWMVSQKWRDAMHKAEAAASGDPS
jgi:hypothetical protein